MSLVQAQNRRVGQFEVGPLSYGLWRFTTPDVAAAQAQIEAALDAGMNLIDTADVYGFDWGGTGFGTVEGLLGQVLAASPGLRDRMVLATKGGIMPPLPYDSSDAYIRSAVDASLSRLNADVIDLYQIHRPDMFTHPAALAETLTALRDAGKIREVGHLQLHRGPVRSAGQALAVPVGDDAARVFSHAAGPDARRYL